MPLVAAADKPSPQRALTDRLVLRPVLLDDVLPGVALLDVASPTRIDVHDIAAALLVLVSRHPERHLQVVLDPAHYDDQVARSLRLDSFPGLELGEVVEPDSKFHYRGVAIDHVSVDGPGGNLRVAHGVVLRELGTNEQIRLLEDDVHLLSGTVGSLARSHRVAPPQSLPNRDDLLASSDPKLSSTPSSALCLVRWSSHQAGRSHPVRRCRGLVP